MTSEKKEEESDDDVKVEKKEEEAADEEEEEEETLDRTGFAPTVEDCMSLTHSSDRSERSKGNKLWI